MNTHVYRFLKYNDELRREIEIDRLTLGLELTSEECEAYCIYLDSKFDTVVGIDYYTIYMKENSPYNKMLDSMLENIKKNGVAV